MKVEIPFDQIDSFSFEMRAEPQDASLRPVYRIVLILLILDINCRGGSCSNLKLQFFNWLLKDIKLQDLSLCVIEKSATYQLKFIHIDPYLNIALQYAIAEKLIAVNHNQKMVLTDEGKDLVALVKQDDLFEDEVAFLLKIGKKVSEIEVGKLI